MKETVEFGSRNAEVGSENTEFGMGKLEKVRVTGYELRVTGRVSRPHYSATKSSTNIRLRTLIKKFDSGEHYPTKRS